MISGCRDVVPDKLPEGSDLERKFAKSSLADKTESAHLFSRRTDHLLSDKVSSGQGHMRRVMEVKGASVLDRLVHTVSTYGKAWMTLYFARRGGRTRY
jgi:hypothetical protein